MVSKKVHEAELLKMQDIIDDKVVRIMGLQKDLAEKEEILESQAHVIDDLSISANLKQTIFLTANVDAYPTKEARDEALDHVRERMDKELERLKIPAQSVLLPDIVTNIHVHEMRG